MSIENTFFIFKLSNAFEKWVKMFDISYIEAFHVKSGLTSIYRGKSLTNPKQVIIVHQAE